MCLFSQNAKGAEEPSGSQEKEGGEEPMEASAEVTSSAVTSIIEADAL